MRITKNHIIWNYIGTIFNHGIGIFILPLVLRLLSTAELGLWYVFGSLAALISLIDFGFSPTIMRNITYTFGGAVTLQAEGVPIQGNQNEPNYSLMYTLIKASRKIYLFLSLFAGIIMFSIGTIYIRSISGIAINGVLIAWYVYAVAIVINIYMSYWNPVLKGIGGIKETNEAILFSRLLYLVIAIISLYLGLGLLGLSIAYLVSGLSVQLVSRYFFLKLVGNIRTSFNDYLGLNDILKVIWPNAKKTGVVTIGAWLITRSTTLLCSTFLGLEETAQYGLSLQLISFVNTFSTLMSNSYIPELAFLEVHRDKPRYDQILSRGLVVQWVVGLSGVVGLAIFGEWALGLIRSNSSLLSPGILMLLGMVLFLEQNHSTFATIITLSNQVPFVKSSLYSGFSIVALGFLVLRFTTLGLLGLIIVQGVVQLAYNNWYWPRLVLKREHLTPFSMFRLAVTLKTR